MKANQARYYLRNRGLALEDHIRRLTQAREELDVRLERFIKDVREWHGNPDDGCLTVPMLAKHTGLTDDEIREILESE